MKEERKSWLARKLERMEQSGGLFNSPLIRLLIHETWFRVAFVLLCVLLIFLALFLPKIWPNTPKDFKVYIAVSGLDHMQAWSLKRSALKAMAEGRDEDAAQAWREAINNTPGTPDLSRGMLQFLLKTDKQKEMMGFAYARSQWLLELTGTNAADVALVSKVYAKYQYYDLLVNMLEPRKNNLTPEQEASFLKGLFSCSRLEEFTNRLARIDRSKITDPDLPLYEAAYQAGWGSEEVAAAGRNRLLEAQKELSQRILATRLLLVVNRKHEDLEGIKQLLQQLGEWRADTAVDHVNYWDLLEAKGQRDAAIEMAKNYNYPPQAPSELIRLAEGYLQLGLEDLAKNALKLYANNFGQAEDIWRIYASILVKQKQWDELLALATQIRRQPMVQSPLSVFSYYLDGIAFHELNRTNDASTAFTRIGEYVFTNRTRTITYAEKALHLGYPEPAQLILRNHNEEADKTLKYWRLLMQAAYELKQPAQMLEAAGKYLMLQPTNPAAMNNYAATLLSLRAKPEDALQITTSLLSQAPDSTPARINHCLALLLNQRTSDAKALLLTIDPLSLSDDEVQAYNQAWLEVHFNFEQWDEVRQDLKKVDRSKMWPAQLKLLEEAQKRAETNAVPSA